MTLLYCAPCGVPFAVTKNGVVVERLSEGGLPHQVYHADVLTCPACDTTILRTAAEPWTESHKPDYEDARWNADYTVVG